MPRYKRIQVITAADRRAVARGGQGQTAPPLLFEKSASNTGKISKNGKTKRGNWEGNGKLAPGREGMATVWLRIKYYLNIIRLSMNPHMLIFFTNAFLIMKL